MDQIEKIEALKQRTKVFALEIIRLFQKLPRTDEARIIGRQLLRSVTSVASNYRASCRARSEAEFFSKISIVVEESDEALFWLELLAESQIISKNELEKYLTESEELVKIFNTIRHKHKKK